MAKIDVIMPQMGESIAEGTLSKWLKKVGDTVKRDEPIFEISTDKVDAEIPAPNAGVLAEILVQEGQTVAIQTVVARIETDASVGASAPASAPAPAAAVPAPTPAAAPAPAPAAPAPAPRPAAASAPTAVAAPPSAPASTNGAGNGRGAPPPEIDTRGPQDGRRARPRSRHDSRHRFIGPRDQERRAAVHRARAGCARATVCACHAVYALYAECTRFRLRQGP